MLIWFGEKDPQKLGSHLGEQDIKNRLFGTHSGFVNLTALSRQDLVGQIGAYNDRRFVSNI
jgi:hypothetical protein